MGRMPECTGNMDVQELPWAQGRTGSTIRPNCVGDLPACPGKLPPV